MRRSSLTVAVLLLMGLFLASGASAEEADLLAQITSPVASATETPADCLGAQSDQEALPSFGVPEPTTAAGTCGACSVTGCQGATIGQYCGFGKTCQNAYGQFCSGTSPRLSKCQCWSGPLP